MARTPEGSPTFRWLPLERKEAQVRYFRSRRRFNIVPAGRRSGKTELAKRRLVIRALAAVDPQSEHYCPQPDPRFFAAAPTRDQAKRIYWQDLKKMIPKALLLCPPIESELTIKLITGAEIVVLGMDKPERIEGVPWNGGVLDEYGNMKPKAWGENVRPALADRQGWCDLIGVPEGRNHYYDLDNKAKALETAGDPEWMHHHWISALILAASEIEAARRDLDELTFAQEYEASFVNFTGRAYYQFGDWNQGVAEYLPHSPLLLGFDFNVEPGVAIIAQLRDLGQPDGTKEPGLVVLGEVYIPRNSNTPAVCRKIIEDWGTHQGEIELYGDASGGARHTSATEGSDWEIIKGMMNEQYGARRVHSNVRRENPTERARVNTVNSLCKSQAGLVRLLVNPLKAPMLVKDLEGVRVLAGGSGEIDKKHDLSLTHSSDALGYIIHEEFPIAATYQTAIVRLKGF